MLLFITSIYYCSHFYFLSNRISNQCMFFCHFDICCLFLEINGLYDYLIWLIILIVCGITLRILGSGFYVIRKLCSNSSRWQYGCLLSFGWPEALAWHNGKHDTAEDGWGMRGAGCAKCTFWAISQTSSERMWEIAVIFETLAYIFKSQNGV